MLPFELIKDTPYLALSGELWSVFYEYFNRNWSCYRGFLLYIKTDCMVIYIHLNLIDGVLYVSTAVYGILHADTGINFIFVETSIVKYVAGVSWTLT